MTDAEYYARRLEVALKAIAKVPAGQEKPGGMQALAKLALADATRRKSP